MNLDSCFTVNKKYPGLSGAARPNSPAVTKDARLVVVVGAVLMQTFTPPRWRLSVIRRTGIDRSNTTPHHTTYNCPHLYNLFQ